MTAKRVLRDLPGVAELEARLGRIATHPYPTWAPENDGLDEAVDRLSRMLFGIVEEDTYFDAETVDSFNEEEAIRAYERHEQNFQFLYEGGEEADAAAEVIWPAMGWDVTDGNGDELRAVGRLGRQIIAVAKGLGGTEPGQPRNRELTDRETQDIEARLAAEAAKFRPKR